MPMRTTFTEPKVVVSAQVPREHREALELMAARDDRTLSYVVRCAVREFLRSGSGVTEGASLSASPDDRGAA